MMMWWLRHLFWHFVCSLPNCYSYRNLIEFLRYKRDEIPSKLASFAISLAILWGDSLVLLRKVSFLFAHNFLGNHSFSNQSNWLPHFVVCPPTRERELLCVVSLAISPIIAAPSLCLSYFLHSSAQLRKKEKIKSKNNREDLFAIISSRRRQRDGIVEIFSFPDSLEHVPCLLVCHWLMPYRK